ncbi:MAG: indole-3-glycerol phosphate synthase TrpC [Prolixibacteraceae bacterium]|jgi:indole-3-glycerol phosphate synthase|nr:indole-3-glycerol phosphate synthase TrpC [Prolixibacteraceae bacterium]MDD4755309.1 indole-3-glycerol phosphate synthase TrpC [Prolixibacteraceae bacterium]NLO02469.1 indole-3-glycerol phosphate synthase TrpC [Bacteroidales bacterium]
MDILKKITETKAGEVFRQKGEVTVEQLKMSRLFNRPCNSLKSSLLDLESSGIIAEFKQRSPSAGAINVVNKVEKVTMDYVNAGAAGLSVLTDSEYFGGSLDNLRKARKTNPDIPLLRKDFIIDQYQVYESKASGADVILLIAACLTKEKAELFAKEAKSLGMEVIMEIHDSEELCMLNDFIDIVGINNRNLKSFKVDIDTSVKLSGQISDKYVKISESGLSSPQDIKYLKKYGFRGFLIGENFMRSSDPGLSCKLFIEKL